MDVARGNGIVKGTKATYNIESNERGLGKEVDSSIAGKTEGKDEKGRNG